MTKFYQLRGLLIVWIHCECEDRQHNFMIFHLESERKKLPIFGYFCLVCENLLGHIFYLGQAKAMAQDQRGSRLVDEVE